MLNKGKCLIIKVHGVIEALLSCETGAQVPLGLSPGILPVRLSKFALVGTDLSEVRRQLVLLENTSQFSPVILVLAWVQYSLGSSAIKLSSILVEPDAYSPNSISSNTLARATTPYPGQHHLSLACPMLPPEVTKLLAFRKGTPGETPYTQPS